MPFGSVSALYLFWEGGIEASCHVPNSRSALRCCARGWIPIRPVWREAAWAFFGSTLLEVLPALSNARRYLADVVARCSLDILCGAFASVCDQLFWVLTWPISALLHPQLSIIKLFQCASSLRQKIQPKAPWQRK